MMSDFDRYDEPRIHMERLLAEKLVNLDLSLRILIPLENAEIRTIGDLVHKTRSQIQSIRQIGTAGMRSIDEVLARYDLHFAT